MELPFVDLLSKRLKEREPLMQFVVGPRQVGKTTGVEQVVAKVKTPYHYILVEGPQTGAWLKEQWWYALSLSDYPLLVVDEIQKVENWAETLKYLWDQTKKDKKQIKCVFLGSSSLAISQGAGESLAGRLELIQVPHWNFETSQRLLPSLSLEQFLRMGGYPGSSAFASDRERWAQYIRSSVVEAVLTKDIFSVATVKKPALFRQLVDLLASYPAQEVSYTKLLGQLQESGNVEIIKHYLQLLDGAFLFRSLEKYSPKKVLQKASSPKIIPMCPALIEALAPEVDAGRRFEAYVGSQLLLLGGELYYWREGSYEVDFVYKSPSGKSFAVEAKSGKKKHSASLEKLLERFSGVEPLIVDQKNMARLPSLLK